MGEKSKHFQRQDMADLLKNVLQYLKVKKEITKDNVAFRIVTVGSFGIFMLCSIINGVTIYAGHPIICDEKAAIGTELIEAQCWLHGSYDLGIRLKEELEHENCYRKNRPVKLTDDPKTKEPKVGTKYYQWVVCALVLSAIICRLPAWIWSMLEGRLMANFYNSNKDLDVLRGKEDDLNHLVKKEAKVFKRLKKGRWTTNTYYLKFFACQCLALLVVYQTFHRTDQFLDGKFWSYGIDTYEYYNRNESDMKSSDLPNPMCNTFPTIVACKFKYTGTGGGFIDYNSYCILSQNIINDKIYLALWFWLWLVWVIMIAQLIWEGCFLTVSFVDCILKLALPSSFGISKYFRQFLIGQVTTGATSLTRNMVTYLQNLSFGDVFVLYQLGKNTHPDFLYEMLIKLSANEHETETDETEPMLGGNQREENGMEMNSVVTSN